MSDEIPLPRARPAAPAIPPFRGHAPAARPALVPKVPAARRGAPPVVAVRPAKTEADTLSRPEAAVGMPDVESTAQAPAPAPAAPPSLVLEPPGAEVMPPTAHQIAEPTSETFAVAAPAHESRGPHAPAIAKPGSRESSADTADAEPLAGLPYFDDVGQPHGAVQSPVSDAPTVRDDAGLGTALVLERIAARIRAGALSVSLADGEAGEAETLAAVLAGMLRLQRR